MWRYELSGEQFDAIRPLPPARNSKGCPACEDRQLLDGMFWVLCAPSPRRDTPARYGPWQTVYDRFRKWRRNAQRAYHGGRPLAFGKQLYR